MWPKIFLLRNNETCVRSTNSPIVCSWSAWSTGTVWSFMPRKKIETPGHWGLRLHVRNLRAVCYGAYGMGREIMDSYTPRRGKKLNHYKWFFGIVGR